MRRRRLYEMADTLEELREVPLGDRIVTKGYAILVHEETGDGKRYWIADGTLEPLQASESWLPAIILPEWEPVSDSDTTTTKHA